MKLLPKLWIVDDAVGSQNKQENSGIVKTLKRVVATMAPIRSIFSLFSILIFLSLTADASSFKCMQHQHGIRYCRTATHCSSNRLQASLRNDDATTGTDSTVQSLTSVSSHNLILYTSAVMFLLSAPLGMMLDNYHGKHESDLDAMTISSSVTEWPLSHVVSRFIRSA